MLSEYRQRFSEYHIAVMRDRCRVILGRQRRSEEAALFNENRDLFAPAVIDDLRCRLEATPADRQADHAGVRRLLAFAADGFVIDRLREIDAEIDRYPGEREAIDDLRRERLEKMRQAVGRLGWEGYAPMRAELRDTPLDQLAAIADSLQAKTMEAAERGLAWLLAHELGIGLAGSTSAEIERLERTRTGIAHFTAEWRLRRYADLLHSLGLRPDQQPGLEIHQLPADTELQDSLCLTVRSPGEVVLCHDASEGLWSERRFWRSVGTALSHVWTSASLPAEFRVVSAWGDRALEIAWGLLFEGLLDEPAWLAENHGYRDNGNLRRTLAVLSLISLRRQSALLLWELRLCAGGPGRSTSDYAELMSRASLVTVEPRGSLQLPRQPLLSADLIRAAAFAHHCREYLRSSHGLRWWESRRSRDFLIDLWNTGQRYTVEHLASAAGIGPLDYQWLAEDLTRAAAGK